MPNDRNGGAASLADVIEIGNVPPRAGQRRCAKSLLDQRIVASIGAGEPPQVAQQVVGRRVMGRPTPVETGAGLKQAEEPLELPVRKHRASE